MDSRINEVVRSIEHRLDISQDPTSIRIRCGLKEIGRFGGRFFEVEYLSTELLRRGYGLRHQDDEVPF
jgi:hypothetical protein